MVYCSRLLPEKRVMQAVQAMSIVLQKMPSAKLVVIGDGPDRAAIEDYIARHGLSRAVLMQGAVYDEKALARYFLTADVAVCPGAIGLMAHKAFSYGLPVLTSDNLWLHGPEIAMVQPGKTGWFFRDNDVASLADTWIDILAKPGEIRAMADECKRMVEQEYSIEHMCRVFDEAVAFVLRPSSRRDRNQSSPREKGVP